MKRTVIWSLVAVVALATLTSLWFLQNFEQVPSSRWETPHKEARRNPYLALERLFEQLGHPIERINSPRSLDKLPTDGALILDENRRRNIDPARAERLLDWVRNSGYLIVVAENASDDPLLSKLGLTHYQAPPFQCNAGDIGNPEKSEALLQKKPRLIEFNLPDNDTLYRLEHSGRGLSSSLPEPVWRAGPTETRNALLHFAWGRGQITVFDNLEFLDNRGIGQFDHAELIWALLQRYQPQGKLHLASRMEIPTLWEWLAESAWMLLISAAVLIALWLWRIIPRFGGTLTTPINERRDLTQHLSAIGRCVWREGGLAHWLTVVRQAMHKRLSLRHPYLNQQDASEQHIALAKIAACKTKDIWSALTPGQAQSPDEFTKTMQTLQRLDQRL